MQTRGLAAPPRGGPGGGLLWLHARPWPQALDPPFSGEPQRGRPKRDQSACQNLGSHEQGLARIHTPEN